jgi:hypothetical protein
MPKRLCTAVKIKLMNAYAEEYYLTVYSLIVGTVTWLVNVDGKNVMKPTEKS